MGRPTLVKNHSPFYRNYLLLVYAHKGRTFTRLMDKIAGRTGCRVRKVVFCISRYEEQLFPQEQKHYMYTIGINAAFHDSSACIIKDGILLAAAEEERFTYVKHGKRPIPFSTYELPFHATDYCLGVAGIHINDVDHFAYAFDPYILLGEKHADAVNYRTATPTFSDSLRAVA